jgi:hypothetical protein
VTYPRHLLDRQNLRRASGLVTAPGGVAATDSGRSLDSGSVFEASKEGTPVRGDAFEEPEVKP